MNDPIPNVPRAQPPIDDIADLAHRSHARIEVTFEDLSKLLTNITTNAWKARGRVSSDPKGEELREEMKKEDIKKIARHLDSILNALADFGVEIRDRTGETYDFGLRDKIVSSVPRAGIAKELIVETLRPTVYWHSHIVQDGEVIIAVPAVVEEKQPEKI
jgi:hypothetical protein